MTREERGRRPLSVIGAASSAGAYGPGQEEAPAAFRRHGLLSALRATGRDSLDHGGVAVAHFREDPDHPKAKNVELVAAVDVIVAHHVARALAAGDDVLVLGGDCTVELGTVAGAVSDGSRVGLIYIDLDTDLNTPETGDGVFDWMGVAHLLDVPGCEPRLAALGGVRRPLLDPEGVLFLAADLATEAEQAIIDRLELRREDLETVITDTAAVLDRARDWATAFDRVLVHVDADVLDFASFPIAENARRVRGLPFETLSTLMRELCRMPNARGLTLAEINPHHAENEAMAFARLIGMLSAAVGGAAARQLTNDDPSGR